MQSYLLMRQTARSKLREQLAFKRAMLEQIPHAICVRDRDGRLTQCNAAYERLFGVARAQVVGRTVLETGLGATGQEQLEQLQQRYLRVITGSERIAEDAELSIAGRQRKIFHWAAPIVLEPGEAPAALVAGAIDLTERQQLVEALDAARIEAESASRAKSNFLATMSHEIRTPMNAVMGMLELMLREGRLAATDRESAELARTSAKSLLGLIDDILDLSKIDAGGLEVLPAPSALRPLVGEVAQVFGGMAQQRGLAIAVEIDAGLAERHLVDAARFRQLANNLVSNAIKYTDRGGVTVRLRQEGRDEHTETVVLEVEDSGIGIASADLENLFRPFFQAESAGPRTVGGTGLGLPIVQRLSQAMGGEVDIRSEPGKGTCVRIRLRLEVAPSLDTVARPAAAGLSGSGAQAALALPWQGSGIRILAVDDHPANRLLLERQLAHLGAACELASDGEEAWALWCAGDFDLLITDCSMPRMDGYALTRAVRDRERELQLPRRPVLGCTAHVQEQDRRQALEAGMDDCLMKPVSLDVLAAAFRQHLAEHLPHGPALAAADPSTGSGPDSKPAFDPLALGSFSGGDREVEMRFFDVLGRTNRADLLELTQQLQAGEWAAAAATAHKIKGAARLIEAARVDLACARLEQACGLADASAATAARAALESSIGELEAAMAARAEALRAPDAGPGPNTGPGDDTASACGARGERIASSSTCVEQSFVKLRSAGAPGCARRDLK